jgi:hypothetical protein
MIFPIKLLSTGIGRRKGKKLSSPVQKKPTTKYGELQDPEEGE